MKNWYLYIVVALVLVSYNQAVFANVVRNNNFIRHNDSILHWIKLSKNKNRSFQDRKRYLDKAYFSSLSEKGDSLRNAYFLKISLSYYKLNDSISFRKVNKLSTNLSIKINDSSSLAANYWDLGRFYSNIGFKDSAYYTYSKAQKLYERINDFYNAVVLLNMAIIQSDIKDYTGSEVTTIKAIALFKPLKKYRHLYRCYNNLGVSFNNLGEYEKALLYHNKALEFQRKIKGENSFKENTLNNIGVSYEMQKKYKEAIRYYLDALAEDNLKQNNIKLYAKILDNLAYSKLKLEDVINTEKLFYESLQIRDSIGDYLGLAINKLHLAEFYAYKKDTLKALKFASETRSLASETKNFRELLRSLLLLSKLDADNNSTYTNRYIKLNDSLLMQERAIRNKFTRIQFETDEFIDKNRRLNQERNLILLTASCILLLGALFYLSLKQRARQKELEFVQTQQKANEEIYNLMLAQQNKLEEGRKKEKKRISEELHDGVLGKLFGTRLILGTLNNKNDEGSISEREKYINDLQQIEDEVRNVSHVLNSESEVSDVSYTHIINDHIEDQSKVTNFTYEVVYDDNVVWEDINGGIKMNLFRIIQEAVQNINKYSKAKHVNLEFKIHNDRLSLSIEDDGIGFNAETKKNGIGLKNMQSRIDKLNGELLISSKKDEGTLIVAMIPLYG